MSAKAWLQETAWYLGEVGGRGKALRLAGVCTTADTAGCKQGKEAAGRGQDAGEGTVAMFHVEEVVEPTLGLADGWAGGPWVSATGPQRAAS